MSPFRTFAVVSPFVILAGAASCSAPAPPVSDSAQPAASSAASAASAQAVPAPNGGLPHPCTLLTAKDVEDVLGPGATLERDSESTCAFKSAKGAGEIDVKIEPLDRDTWDGGETMMRMDKTAKKVTGVGESGYTFMSGTVVFAKGRAQVMVIMSLYKGTIPALDAAQIVGKKIAAAL